MLVLPKDTLDPAAALWGPALAANTLSSRNDLSSLLSRPPLFIEHHTHQRTAV